MALDIAQLRRYAPRKFVPRAADFKDAAVVRDLYGKLLVRTLSSKEEFKQWLADRSELEAALDQEGTVLYIRMTCQTDDEVRAQAYQNFIATVVPAVKPLVYQLNQKYITERQRFPGENKFFEVYDRSIKADVALFVEANVPLQTQEALLSQEYQTLCGSMTVSFQGKEMTLPQMGKFLQDPDRKLREEAWRATAARRAKEKDRFEDLFEKMLAIRGQIARNAGDSNFTEYQFKAFHRFDYLPEDCKQYHESTEKLIVPLLKKILERRARQMNLPSLRPWDLAVDPLGRPPLKPFGPARQLIEGVEKIFERTDRELAWQFKETARLGLLDLESRKGKAPGGYQSTLAEARQPFIFMNAVGIDSDVRTLLHEAGHAFHALASANQPILAYRHAPMEFCEVASMSMELLGGEYLDVFYNPEDKERSQASHLEDIIQTLVWVATIDCFQHWIYEHPSHQRNERQKAWLDIRKRFGGEIADWKGLEEYQATLWHRQLHIFEVPLYYIEYGIAQLGALQIWQKAKENQKTALASYRKALSLGGSRPLPELFGAAGLPFDFSAGIMAPLMARMEEELFLQKKGTN